MPTISSEITSVDTLQILPAGEAFREGSLLMHHAQDSAGDAAFMPDAWGSSPLNWWLMAMTLVFIILYMRRFISILPYIGGGLLRWRNLVSMEGNMRLCRERDSVAAVSVLVTCAAVSRLGLFNPEFMTGLSPAMKTLTSSGLILGYLIVRAVLIAIVPASRFRHDNARISNSCGANFFIATSAVLLILLITSSLSASWMEWSRHAAAWSTGFLWAVFMLRKYQILSPDAGHFAAILYLCTIEILPAVMLAVSVIYL